MEHRIRAVASYHALRGWKYEVIARRTKKRFDVLVVGGGPAGIAAAVCAAESGARVGIVDDNPALGGQIWRGAGAKPSPDAANWIERLLRSDFELLCGTRVFDQPEANVLRAETLSGSCDLEYGRLVLATGARERFLPFPGWTLPNVMGAGALQALVKSGLPIAGKRVVIAGTGPLLLAVAAYLRKHGAKVVVICEQASLSSLAVLALTLARYRDKVSQAISLRKDLAGVPLATSSWPIAAEGAGALTSVVVSRGGKRERIDCDYLACGFHLIPNTELASLLGCRLHHGYVQVDDFQQTSINDVFCAGEPTGIGGLELSLVEGQIAGFAAAGNDSGAKKLFLERRKLRGFARALERAFELRPELKHVALSDTIVCRCEDVTYERLTHHGSWRSAKLQTRCGMGPCQGRVCAPATEFLLNWRQDSVRPPIFPAGLESLVANVGSNVEHTGVMRGHS